MTKSLPLDKIKLPSFYYKNVTHTDKEKLFFSIKKWGIIRNIVVRQVGDFYEIVEGRFIFECAVKLSTVYIQAVDLGEISESETKLANIALNFSHSYEDHASIAFDVAALCNEFSVNELCKVLPYTPEQIQRFKEISEFSWDGFKKQYSNDQVGMFDLEEPSIIESNESKLKSDENVNVTKVIPVQVIEKETLNSEENIEEKDIIVNIDTDNRATDSVEKIEDHVEPQEEELIINEEHRTNIAYEISEPITVEPTIENTNVFTENESPKIETIKPVTKEVRDLFSEM